MKVTVLPASFSGEEVVQQALDAAKSQMPAGKEPPKASVERDANGKVTKVNVTLPEGIAQNDLANAAAKINENPGVSKASPFPIVNPLVDLEDLADGDPIPSFYNSLRWSDWKANATSPITGTRDATCQTIGGIASVTANASDFGFSRMIAYRWKWKMKCDQATWGDGGNGGTILLNGNTTVQLAGFNGFWQFKEGGNTNPFQQSAIAYAANTTYEIEVVAEGRTKLVYIDGVLLGAAVASFDYYYSNSYVTYSRDFSGGASEITQGGWMDDLEFTLVDASDEQPPPA